MSLHGRMTTLQLMQAATMIQNPRVMPRRVTPEDVMNRGAKLDSPVTGAPVPETAREVAGMSDGVMRAERAEREL